MLGKNITFKEGQLYKVYPSKNRADNSPYVLKITDNCPTKYIGVVYGSEHPNNGRYIVDDWEYDFLSNVDEFKEKCPEYFL